MPPTINRKPIILNPSASSLMEMKLIPIHIQTIPKAKITMPAIKKGLKSIADSLLDLVNGSTLII
jgi:CRISPR/Cas system Type II protein with McrA/HNH and RuvC-like nuclease domain